MRRHLLIESRDHFGRVDGGFCLELAQAIAADGGAVTLLLVQNGVLAARSGVLPNLLSRLVAGGTPVLADRFSLAERGIGEEELGHGIQPTSIEIVIDGMVDGWNVLWH